MIYLLDTNTCIGYINRRSLPIFRRLSALATEDIALCDVVKFELYYGAYRSSRSREKFTAYERIF